MKVKFNKYERIAGLFLVGAILGSAVVTVGIGLKRGWFEARTSFETKLTSAEGLREGTPVQIAGLRAGSVTHVDLKSNNEIVVRFEVSKKFAERLRKDSVVRLMRPFIIGEKILDVTVGSDASPQLAENAILPSEPSFDVMDMMSGRTLGPYLETVGEMVQNLRIVAEAILDPKRSQAIIGIFDELQPLVKNMNSMSGQVATLLKQTNDKKQMATVVNNLVVMTNEMNRMLPALSENAPQMAADLAKITRNTAVLLDELQGLGPEIPRASRRAIEALDETVVTLKALQKSFLLRGNVKDVREEESQRAPASDKSTDK